MHGDARNLFGPSPVVGCVADNEPKYLEQALRLLQSWRWFGGALSAADFHVCVVDGVDERYRRLYEEYGAGIHIVPPVDLRNLTANKLRFFELPVVQDADRVILLDCDTIVVQEPLVLLQPVDFLAKIVDMPTVTPEMFSKLFDELDILLPPCNQHCTVKGEPIIPYFNSGVLSFSRKAISTLAPEWIRIFKILIERLELFGERPYFCEQASLALALAACGTSFKTLGNEMNFPAHLQDQPLDSAFAHIDPVIIHYHWLADSSGYLSASPYPHVDRRICQFNERLQREGKNGRA